MRLLPLTLIVPILSLAPACQTAPQPVPQPTSDAAPAAPDAPLALTDITPENRSMLGADLRVTGKLGPGVDGKDLQWTAKTEQIPLGSGTVPIEMGDNRTFTAAIPILFGKTLADLGPYQADETVEIAIDTVVGGKSASRTAHVRAPRVPVPKILSVQATRTSSTTIDLTYLFALDNTNLYPIKINGIDYKGTLAGKVVMETQTPTASALPMSGQTEFSFPAQATPDNCGKDIHTMTQQKNLHWTLGGVVHYEVFDAPFSIEGDLQITKTED